jgi:hypothetical protein
MPVVWSGTGCGHDVVGVIPVVPRALHGRMFSRLYGPGYVGWSRLISFESDPIHFVAALGASVLVTAFRLYVFSLLFVKVRRWWTAR